MKESRHNGRAGKNGIYNPKHNDRSFDIENSEHIDAERAKQNIYWDCFQGYRRGDEYIDNCLNFEEVEKKYYEEHYGEYCEKQNSRNIANRHPERNITTEDIRLNKQRCPEETVIQFGDKNESVPPEVLIDVAEEYFERMDALYGSNYHIIDWALHADETTPHIHERHVFDIENQYGEIVPQQEKAMKAMGIELPKADKKEGRHNNRKMTFDKECRELLAQIAAEHGVEIELVPVYGGRAYMEKQDYIIAKQKEEIEEITNEINTKQQELDIVMMKLSDVDELVKEVTDEVYYHAVEVTKNKAEEIVGDVIINNIAIMDERINTSSTYNQGHKVFASKILGHLKDAIRRSMDAFGEKIKDTLLDSSTMNESKTAIQEKAGISIRERLERGKLEAQNNSRVLEKKNKDFEL